jgi:hypothetical protein
MVIDVKKLTLSTMIAIALSASMSTGIAATESAGSGKRLCAITSTLTCDIGSCVSGPANAVNLPVFIRIDTDSNLIETAMQGGERRSSAITNTRTEGDSLVLLGGELERGWSLVVDQPAGSLTGTIAGNGIGYIIFGSCLTD